MPKNTSHSRRELELLDALRRVGGSARNAELAGMLDVSEETVRRTIKSLSKQGSVARVHGGAHLIGTQSDPSFYRRVARHADEKQVIARAVLDRVRDGMSLFLDVGSTTSFIAEELRARQNLMVATNSLGVAQSLVGHNGNRVYLLGGEMHRAEMGAFGHVTEQQARRYAYDLAILSADALHPSQGFLYLSEAEAALASVVMDVAGQTLTAMTHHKFTATAPHRGFDASGVAQLVTDRAPGADMSRALASWGIDVHVAAPPTQTERRAANHPGGRA
ncbi:DeoR/GlpR family DNA-binding transcription regulator [Rhodobacteraceae bacterium KMM 6894]|nr:DeoR/GlpR family DNA-binding transcription regulator [Rhodobacteraceae bacterium KMM 6894]